LGWEVLWPCASRLVFAYDTAVFACANPDLKT
jgi:hypothetical protein